MASGSAALESSYHTRPDFIVISLELDPNDPQIATDLEFTMSGDWLHTGAQQEPQGKSNWAPYL